MNKIYITKVLAKGSGKTDSIIEFRPGLNIIQGHSNTGKTCIMKCIDYCFGAGTLPFDASLGYTTIELRLNTPQGYIHITRSLDDKNKVHVITNIPEYKNGSYRLKPSSKVKEHEPTLGDLLFSSIGIKNTQYIFKNKSYETQRMGWRTILPLLLYNVSDITRESSVIEPIQNVQKTAFLSALLVLINGTSNVENVARTRKDILVARKSAVEEYVNKNISKISEKKKILEEKLSSFGPADPEQQMQTVIEDIKSTEDTISSASSQSKKILTEIIKLQEQELECNLLQTRYATLHGQYISDIKRLAFIVDGENEIGKVPHNTICPFCDNKIPLKDKKSYSESAQMELHRITNQMKGLIETEKELSNEKESISAKLSKLEKERGNIESTIQKDLQPKLNSLKNLLDNYRTCIQIRNELHLINDLTENWENDLRELPTTKSESEYHPKELLSEKFQKQIDELLKNALTKCKFPNLTTAHFNLSSFDIEINGHQKHTFNGQGYTSFINSIVALCFRQYLSKYAVFDPGFIIIDTPLEGLDQGVSDESPESMRASFYNYFANQHDHGQIILIDNLKNIPSFDSLPKETNIITFTKNTKKGRYGFLMDVKSE